MNRKIIILIWVLSMLCCVCEKAGAQEALLSSGGTFSDGSVSYSFGLFAYSSYFDGSSSLTEGVQHPWETFGQSSVPLNFSLLNTTINHNTCYNALQNITVAGDGKQVDIESTAFVEFIAGKSIRFLPGFHAQAGSYVNAHITTSGEYCYFAPPVPIVKAEPLIDKSIEFETNNEMQQNPFSEKLIKLYPNPNNGQFTLNLCNFINRAEITVFNNTGKVIYRTLTDLERVSIQVPIVSSGIYNVIVSDGQSIVSAKMLVY